MSKVTDEQLASITYELQIFPDFRTVSNGVIFSILEVLKELKQARAEIADLREFVGELTQTRFIAPISDSILRNALLPGLAKQHEDCSFSDSIVHAMAMEIAQQRGELSTLRKSRNHASSYLDCSGRLKIACEALKHIMDTENISQPGDPFESYSLRVAREALTKIGELKSPKQALEKGNG